MALTLEKAAKKDPSSLPQDSHSQYRVSMSDIMYISMVGVNMWERQYSLKF
jgi:hypothetical protein